MTVAGSFEDFRKALEIDPNTVAAAKDLHERARGALENNLKGHVRSFLSGSYARNTRLEPLNDIDIIVVVDSTEPWDDDPEAAMNAAGDAVQPEFPDATIQLGNHAVRVFPKDPPIEGVHLDIVVALHVGPATMHEISERKPEPGWPASDPEAHQDALSKANEAWQKRLVPMIKMIKHWNRNASGEPLQSFLVEALALRLFTGSGDVDRAAMVTKFFDEAKTAILSPTSSPAVPVGYVDGTLTAEERDAHATRLEKASDRAAEASVAADEGDEGAAEEIWYKLFGDPFPKPDQEARKASMAAAVKGGASGILGNTITSVPSARPIVRGTDFGAEEG